MTDTKPVYLFANWKMYLDFAESLALGRELKERQKNWAHKVRMTVFPTALAAEAVCKELADSGISVGAQNVFWHEKGGYTGEVSAPMFQAVGCSYVMLGHSERRYVFNETNHEIREKLESVITTTHLTPLICIGETLREKKDGRSEEVVEAQLRSAFTDLSWPAGKELIVAYEPVWSVGTGEACEPVKAEKMCGLIDRWVRTLVPEANLIILYGGSVRPDNVQHYISEPHIQGCLVGASSTKLETWLEIVDRSIL